MKQVTRIMTMLVLGFAVAGLYAVEARAEKKIGILLFNEQQRYVQNKNGVIDELKQLGFGDSKVKFTVESAGGNKAKADEIARKFEAEHKDMVISIGTSASVAVAHEIKNIPVVFVMVWDPVASKIARDWKSSGNNTTGASSKTSVSKLLGALKEFFAVKKVAVLYTPGERNTEVQLKEFETECGKYDMKIIPVPLSNKEEVSSLLPEVTGAVDAICLTGSSVVGDTLTQIVDIAARAKVITASQSDDHVEGGALLGVTVDPYAVGRLAGEKAAKVLKGAKPSSIPIEALKNQSIIVNMKTAKAGQFRIPPDFMKSVTKTIE